MAGSRLRHASRVALRTAQFAAAGAEAAAFLAAGGLRAGRDRDARLAAAGRALECAGPTSRGRWRSTARSFWRRAASSSVSCRQMTMVNLALMTAEGLGKRLAPEVSLTDEALPYLAEALGRGASAAEAGRARG